MSNSTRIMINPVPQRNGNIPDSYDETFVMGEISDFAPMMKKLINNQEYSDLTFFVGPKKEIIHAHRCILAARCTVFKALLSENLGNDDTHNSCVLHDMSPSIFLAMMEFLYTNCVTLTPHTAIDVLATSLEYGLDGLRDLCVDYLISYLSAASACDVLQTAVTYNQNDLKEKALTFIEGSTADVIRSSSFHDISEDTLVTILRSDNLGTDELELCLAVQKWAAANSAANVKKIKEIAREAVKHLRLPLLCADELKFLERENEKFHFIPAESFSYARELHSIKNSEGNNFVVVLRTGTKFREHHKLFFAEKNV